ncbi:MAG: ATP-binding protein [Ginsengibacter sp.]
MRVIMLISGSVLMLTCAAFFVYEFLTFRQASRQQLSTIAKIVSYNSTAALAFDNAEDASEILAALKAEPHIEAACLYDKNGKLFCRYPPGLELKAFPVKPEQTGYRFVQSHLQGFQPVIRDTERLGTLYLRSDLGDIYEKFTLYGIITALVIVVSFLLAFVLSRILRKNISKPILALAETAHAISNNRDYSVRAVKIENDEIGSLTDAFNQMLIQIHEQNQALSEFNQNLENKVIERTIELEAANKELESFSYSISHDLRAPVRAINSYISIFLEDYGHQFDGEAMRLINVVSNNSRKMGILIDDLLAFARLSRKDLIKADLSMKDLVAEVWEDLRKMEDNRSIKFILGELPQACADRITIQQVWINLVSNALKYTRKKEKTVIEISYQQQKNVTIYYIRDNGNGFDMAYYDKLFGVFQRLHSQEEFEGTGVGLAIVQRIIEKHGGKIWAQSKVDEGATFYFSLGK